MTIDIAVLVYCGIADSQVVKLLYQQVAQVELALTGRMRIAVLVARGADHHVLKQSFVSFHFVPPVKAVHHMIC